MKLKPNAIKLLAAQRGMNLGQLGEKAGITRQSISTINARGTCAALSVVKIAKALIVDVTEILEQEV